MTRILFVGYDPETVDFFRLPLCHLAEMTAEKVQSLPASRLR